MAVRNTINFTDAAHWLTDRSTAAVREAAMYAAFAAKKHAPVDTGHLRSSITVITSNDETMSVVYVGAYYAVFVEYGHTTPSGTYVAPNPFFRRALEETAQAWPQIVQTIFHHREEARATRSDNAYLGAEFTAE